MTGLEFLRWWRVSTAKEWSGGSVQFICAVLCNNHKYVAEPFAGIWEGGQVGQVGEGEVGHEDKLRLDR